MLTSIASGRSTWWAVAHPGILEIINLNIVAYTVAMLQGTAVQFFVVVHPKHAL
jgi:hypothetical protein